MGWLWAILLVLPAAAAGARFVLVRRRRHRPGFSRDRKGRCHYRVWGVDRTAGAKSIFHVDANTPWKAQEMVAEQGIRVEGILEVPRLRRDRFRRRAPADHDNATSRQP
jgi:hypothetical protein